MSVTITCDKECFAPGETLSGTVTWQCSKLPEKIIIELEWSTSGRGSTDIGKIPVESIPCATPSGEAKFSAQIPEDCPPTYKGSLVSISWLVLARADISWAPDPKTSTGIIISKTGQPYSPLDDFEVIDDE